MRTLFTTASLTAMLALTACDNSSADPANTPDAATGRSLSGTVPTSITSVFAVDVAGHRVDAALSGVEFQLELAPGIANHVFLMAGDQPYALTFSDGNGAMQTTLPDFTGAIELGRVDLVRLRATDIADYAEPETNPLGQIDSDDDGVSDLDDDDDDNDGISDEDDDDDDGNGVDDDDEDADSDDDGVPDLVDDDDDNDGISDDEDPDHYDADGDGVSDDEDEDDDNDGIDDDEDDDDDGDGISDEDEGADEGTDTGADTGNDQDVPE